MTNCTVSACAKPYMGKSELLNSSCLIIKPRGREREEERTREARKREREKVGGGRGAGLFLLIVFSKSTNFR